MNLVQIRGKNVTTNKFEYLSGEKVMKLFKLNVVYLTNIQRQEQVSLF